MDSIDIFTRKASLTVNELESDAKTVVYWILLQSCEIEKKETIYPPRTGLSGGAKMRI